MHLGLQIKAQDTSTCTVNVQTDSHPSALAIKSDEGSVMIAGMFLMVEVKLTTSLGSGKTIVCSRSPSITGTSLTLTTESEHENQGRRKMQKPYLELPASHYCLPIFSLEKDTSVSFSPKEVANKRAKLSMLSSSSSLPREEFVSCIACQPA